MYQITEKEAISLLHKYAPDEKSFKIVLDHSKKVQEVALDIAKKILSTGFYVDIEFITTACLLHDIGRFKCPPGKNSIKHGVVGADILISEKLPYEALVCARHIGGGITKEEIKKKKLNLAPEDYVPETIEEKIIAYADKLVFKGKDGKYTRKGTIKERLQKYKKEVGAGPAKMIKKLHEEIQELLNG